MEYIDVNEVKEMFDQLYAWDKKKFIKDLNIKEYLTNKEIISLVGEDILYEYVKENLTLVV